MYLRPLQCVSLHLLFSVFLGELERRARAWAWPPQASSQSSCLFALAVCITIKAASKHGNNAVHFPRGLEMPARRSRRRTATLQALELRLCGGAPLTAAVRLLPGRVYPHRYRGRAACLNGPLPLPLPPLPTGARARRGSEVRDVAGETSVSKHQRENGACRAEGRGGRVGVGEEGDAATILGTRRPQHSKRPAHNRNKHSNHGRLNSIPPFLALLDPPDLPLLRSLLLTRSLTYIFTHTQPRACTHTHTKK